MCLFWGHFFNFHATTKTPSQAEESEVQITQLDGHQGSAVGETGRDGGGAFDQQTAPTLVPINPVPYLAFTFTGRNQKIEREGGLPEPCLQNESGQLRGFSVKINTSTDKSYLAITLARHRCLPVYVYAGELVCLFRAFLAPTGERERKGRKVQYRLLT